MKPIKLKNESGLDFIDISSEEWRMYNFGEYSIQINNPQWLSVSESGGHRILDDAGVSHYIPPKWLMLSWKGNPHFVA